MNKQFSTNNVRISTIWMIFHDKIIFLLPCCTRIIRICIYFSSLSFPFPSYIELSPPFRHTQGVWTLKAHVSERWMSQRQRSIYRWCTHTQLSMSYIILQTGDISLKKLQTSASVFNLKRSTWGKYLVTFHHCNGGNFNAYELAFRLLSMFFVVILR